MNTTHSFNNGFPPTPQSAKFGALPFHSPPTADTSPSEFQTGWMTPQDYTFNSTFQTPGLPDYGLIEEPSSSSSNTSLKRPRPESYQNLIPKLETKKVIPAANIPHDPTHLAFPTNSFLQQFDETHLDEFVHLPSSFPHNPLVVEQIPTPPPTRDAAASARRKANRMKQVIPMHVSTGGGPRRMSVPDEAWMKQPDSVPGFPHAATYNMDEFQLSGPDMYDFDLTGPMTAPAYPQAPVFWDPTATMEFAQPTMPMLTQGMMAGHDIAPTPFVFQSAPISRSARMENHGFAVPSLPSQASRPQTSHGPRPNDSAASRARASTMQSVHMRKASSVDPSVLLTAGAPGALPAAASSLVRSNSVISNSAAEARLPYQYQNEALRRERDERARRGNQPSRSGSIDAGIEQQPAAVTLQRTSSRSNRGGSNRSAQASSVDLSASLSEQGSHIPRNPSPLKQHKSAISQKSDASSVSKSSGRQPVVLTIDSQGRAVTTAKSWEVKTVRKSRSKVAFEEEADLSESDSDDEDLPTGPARSRAPTLTSGLTRSRSLRTSPTRNDGLTRTRSLRTSPEKNEAQAALHEAVKDRRKQSQDLGRSFQCALPAGGDPFVSAPSFAMPPPPPPQSQFMPMRQDSGVWNIPLGASHNNPQHTAPGELEKHFREATRCVCNNMVPNDGQLMVQCESCTKWSHVSCLGLNTQALPPVFVCAFCTHLQQQQQRPVMVMPNVQQMQYVPTMPYGMQMQPMQTMQHFM